MFSATDFLPSTITLLTTCWTSRLLCTLSGSSGRGVMSPRRGTNGALVLRSLDAVLGARLLAVRHAGGVERPAHDLVAHAGKVLHPAAADQHHRVLLEVVALTRNVRRDLHPVREAHARDLAESRVRLLRGGRVHPGA